MLDEAIENLRIRERAPGTIRTFDPQIRSQSAARAGEAELNDTQSNPPICTT